MTLQKPKLDSQNVESAMGRAAVKETGAGWASAAHRPRPPAAPMNVPTARPTKGKLSHAQHPYPIEAAPR